MNQSFWVVLKSLLFLLIVPGIILLVIPHLLVSWLPASFGPRWFVYPGILFMICGIIFLLAGTTSFIVRGHGTPAIWFTKKIKWLIGEEPSILVSGGLYKITRNPMYLGVIIALLGEGLFFQKIILLLYPVVVFIFFSIVILYIEEPHLRNKYGKDFNEYLGRTRRWL